MRQIILFAICMLISACSGYAIGCEISAKSTVGYLKSLPDFNSKLPDCGIKVPKPADALFSTETINFKIFMSDGSEKGILVAINDGLVAEIKEGSSSSPTYVISLGECEFDTLLSSDNKMGTAKYFLDKKKLAVAPIGFWKRFKYFFALMGMKMAITAPPTVEVSCSVPAGEATSKRNVGEECNNGKECMTGNCIGVGRGPPWVYKCSCDAFMYVATDGNGKCPQD